VGLALAAESAAYQQPACGGNLRGHPRLRFSAAVISATASLAAAFSATASLAAAFSAAAYSALKGLRVLTRGRYGVGVVRLP
jgi:hypothetical protein